MSTALLDYPDRPIDRFMNHLKELGDAEFLAVGTELLVTYEAASELASKVELPKDRTATRRFFRQLIDADVALGILTREESTERYGEWPVMTEEG